MDFRSSLAERWQDKCKTFVMTPWGFVTERMGQGRSESSGKGMEKRFALVRPRGLEKMETSEFFFGKRNFFQLPQEGGLSHQG